MNCLEKIKLVALSHVLYAFRYPLTLIILVLCLIPSGYFFYLSVAGLHREPMRSAIHGWDSSLYYFWLRSAVMERPFDFRQSAELTRTMPDKERERFLNSPLTPTGLLPNKYGVGWALSGLPFFLAADGVAALVNTVGLKPIPRDGYGPIYQYALLLGQLGYSVGSLLFAWRIARCWVPDPHAYQGVLLCWLGSFLVPYQTWLLSMAHNLTFFSIAWATWAALRVREPNASTAIWLQLGFASGLALITRYQAGVYLLFPAYIVLRALFSGSQRERRGSVMATLCGAATVFIQLIAWKIVYGSWLIYSYEGESFNWFQPHIFEVLFSPFHGLFYWSPSLLIGLAGLLLWRKQARDGDVGNFWLLSFLLSVWVNGAWNCWWFGDSYGSRAFDACVIYFMVGTAWLLHACATHPWRKKVLTALLLFFGGANLLLAHQVLIGRLSLAQPLTYLEMLRSFNPF